MIAQKGCDRPKNEESQTKGYCTSKTVNKGTSEVKMFPSCEKVYMKGRCHDH